MISGVGRVGRQRNIAPAALTRKPPTTGPGRAPPEFGRAAGSRGSSPTGFGGAESGRGGSPTVRGGAVSSRGRFPAGFGGAASSRRGVATKVAKIVPRQTRS